MSHRNQIRFFLRQKREHPTCSKQEHKYLNSAGNPKKQSQFFPLDDEHQPHNPMPTFTDIQHQHIVYEFKEQPDNKLRLPNAEYPKRKPESQDSFLLAAPNIDSIFKEQTKTILNTNWIKVSEILRRKSQLRELDCSKLLRSVQQLIHKIAQFEAKPYILIQDDITLSNKNLYHQLYDIDQQQLVQMNLTVSDLAQIQFKSSYKTLQSIKTQRETLKKNKTKHILNPFLLKAMSYEDKHLLSSQLHINEYLQLDFGQEQPQLVYQRSNLLTKQEVLDRYPTLQITEEKEFLKSYLNIRKRIRNHLIKCKANLKQFPSASEQNDLMCLSYNQQFAYIDLPVQNKPKIQKYQFLIENIEQEIQFDLQQQSLVLIVQPGQYLSFYSNTQHYDLCLEQKYQQVRKSVLFPSFEYKANRQNNEQKQIIRPTNIYRSVEKTKQILIQSCVLPKNLLSEVVLRANRSLSTNKILLHEGFYLFLHLASEGICQIQILGNQLLIYKTNQ